MGGTHIFEIKDSKSFKEKSVKSEKAFKNLHLEDCNFDKHINSKRILNNKINKRKNDMKKINTYLQKILYVFYKIAGILAFVNGGLILVGVDKPNVIICGILYVVIGYMLIMFEPNKEGGDN